MQKKSRQRAPTAGARKAPSTRPIRRPAEPPGGDERLRRFHAALEAAQDELESFCYSVSHDLRAPLRSIDGFSHALLHEFGSTMQPQEREYLQRIIKATKRTGRLIEELLSISRIQRAEINREDLNLAEIAKQVIAGFQEASPDRRVEVSIPPRLCANGDSKLVRTVLEKLLDNAWKFTSKTDSPQIELLQAATGSDPVFVVRDNGIGFDMANAGKLFKAFQRMHSQCDFPGLGTGLATARAIIRRHGGRIWTESAPDQGASFYFSLGSAAPLVAPNMPSRPFEAQASKENNGIKD